MKKRILHHLKSAVLLIGGLAFTNIASAQYTTAAAYPFSASTEPYVYVTGGTSVSLQGDDVTVTNIPIGFSFPFTTSNYTTVSACTNGWLSLNNSSSTTWTNSTSDVGTIGPAVFPLFDDQWGTSGTATFSYITTGTSPNKVFTFEWRALDFPRLTTAGAISFQVKLFENGMIKFCYKQEPPTPGGTASASIGIGKSATDWLSLNDASSTPVASSSSFTTSIGTRPATDQVYTFGQPPCLYAPVNGTSSNATSSKITFNWANSTNGAPPQGYEIAVDQNPTGPVSGTPITGTTYNQTGLTPGTSYYAHVRARCSALSTSTWLNIPGATTICIAPQVSMANVTHNSALALWNSLPPAINYQYIVNTTGIPPINDNGAGNTKSNSAQLTGLTPNTNYYLYMRTQCTNNETSDWEATQFTTMEECQKPEPSIIKFSSLEMQATWNEIPTAVAYEYAVNSYATPPALGNNIYQNDVNISIPNDDKPYYLHVRANCVSIYTHSEWATIKLREGTTTGIDNVNNNSLLITAYPNPVKNMITVNLNGLNTNAATISITDITGKALYTANVTSAVMNLDMSSMPAGIYMIKYNGKEQSQVIKVTKQ